MRMIKMWLLGISLLGAALPSLWADSWKRLLEVPDYEWHAGCFGTASGNLMGFWDRHGLPNCYTGPTGGGLAPLNTSGANFAIRAMWASQAGVDGRPANKPGHMDDYYVGYESTASDPYVTAGRAEHAQDCIGDFIGVNQKKWTNLNNECAGNIDGFSFVFWDTNGFRRTNFQPTNSAGEPIPDIPSGLRAWAQYRGYDAEVFSQVTDFNPHVPPGRGFTFANLKAEIDAGYPVLCFLQLYNEYSRHVGTMTNANPEIHGIMAYGYNDYPSETPPIQSVYFRSSWGDSGGGDPYFASWTNSVWLVGAGMPVRGVIGFHPRPKIRSAIRANGQVTISWDGPSSQLNDEIAGTTTTVHRYQLERATSLSTRDFVPVGAPTTDRIITVPETAGETVFYRVSLLPP